MKHTTIFTILCTITLSTVAQNPIAPPGVYTADPSGHAWNGKLYIYGSRDENKSYYCSKRYDLLSSTNLKDWTIHKDIFASTGKKDEIPYSDGFLYAPDCVYKDGRYHLVYCMSGQGEVEGTATSLKPEGPFKAGKPLKGVTQIDPAVFIDDDGSTYLYWGQFNSKVAKFKPNMQELDFSTYKDSIITEKEHGFHEGIQMVKRNGIYYLVYADISRRGMPTSIGYSYGKTPYGPFTYGGIIIDNFGCDPNVWNNHGSIVEFNKQWYILYHRSTHGCVAMRKACIEPITFNEDGTINEVEMTTQGAAGPLDPMQKISAACTCYLTGQVRVEALTPDNDWLTHINNLNTAVFKYFDFIQQPKKFTIRLTPKKGGKIIVFANNLCLPVLAVIDVPTNGYKPITLTVPVTEKISGVHPIYMRFYGEEGYDLFNIDWFKFE